MQVVILVGLQGVFPTTVTGTLHEVKFHHSNNVPTMDRVFSAPGERSKWIPFQRRRKGDPRIRREGPRQEK